MDAVHLTLIILPISLCIKLVATSPGDYSLTFNYFVRKCFELNCTDEYKFKRQDQQPLYLQLFGWNCMEECYYESMWKAINHTGEVYQYFGKWPFVRFYGIQEPASAFFSLLNFAVHVDMLRKFRKYVSAKDPLYWMWHFYCLIHLHAWFWSTVFHSRDTFWTEKLDYACAFSIILVNFYFVIIRILRGKIPKIIMMLLSCMVMTFYSNYVLYTLLQKSIDYGYNMQVNIIVGTVTAFSWLGWCMLNYRNQPYVWKCVVFVLLTAGLLLLEVIDQPPLFYIFDSHSIWHFLTAPTVVLFYSFGIDDCLYLAKTDYYSGEEEKRTFNDQKNNGKKLV